MRDNSSMKPAFKITVNGSDITEVLAGRLVSLSITDEAGVNSDRVELEIDDRDERLTIPPLKATMTVEIGYQGGALVKKGTYTIEDIDVGGPLRYMTMRGTSVGASKGAAAGREASWDNTTLGEVAKTIAGRHGWKLAISSDLSGVQIEHTDQHENDLQFLSRLAAENDAVAKVASGRLIITPHASGKRASGADMPVTALKATSTTEWNMTMAGRGDYSGVTATYHDLATGTRGEVVQGESGVNNHTLPHNYQSRAAAQRAAKAKMNSLKRNKRTLSIHAMPGDPNLRAETKVNATGFRTGVDGEWIIIRARHQITDSGYTCSLDCETPQTSK